MRFDLQIAVVVPVRSSGSRSTGRSSGSSSTVGRSNRSSSSSTSVVRSSSSGSNPAQELLKVQHGQAQAHQNLLDALHLVVHQEVEPNEKKIWIWSKKATWSNKFAYAVVYFFKCNGTGWL